MPAAALPLPLELLPLLPPELLGSVSELASALLLSQLYLPWIWPPPPWDAGANFLNAAQDVEMSLVETMSKAPLTSLRAGNSMLQCVSKKYETSP